MEIYEETFEGITFKLNKEDEKDPEDELDMFMDESKGKEEEKKDKPEDSAKEADGETSAAGGSSSGTKAKDEEESKPVTLEDEVSTW